MRLEGLYQWKIPVTPSGIKPVTFQFVAHSLNHCTTVAPNESLWLVLWFLSFFHVSLIYLFSSSEDEDEEEEEELELDDSDDSDVAGRNRRGGSGRHRRNAEPVRRSTRARITRFDKEFSKLLLMIT